MQCHVFDKGRLTMANAFRLKLRPMENAMSLGGAKELRCVLHKSGICCIFVI